VNASPDGGAAGGRLAVLDVGSNSLRLLCCTGIGPGGPEGERRTVVVGLRRGAGSDGSLAEDALGRLGRHLAGMGRSLRRFAPARSIAVCTSAVREAPNRERVRDLVTTHTGARVRVLSGDEEAKLAFAGAALAVEGPEPVLMIDVGGGSTELVVGAGGRPRGALSLALGAVRHTERHISHDPPLAAEVDAVRREARGDAARALAAIGRAPRALAVAGTATTLAAVDLGRYDPSVVHGHRITARRIEELIALLAGCPLAERRRLPGLDPARAGVIVAGAAILSGVIGAAGLNEVTVSERDILDGAAMALAAGTI
jgi:exopolyphosphatase / guanosine-5'-triphosphate,3'-diphosphate pyrophosphatase